MEASQREALEQLFEQHDCGDYRWLPVSQITVAHWVRMKCIYGCPDYGKSVACPPNNPPVDECRRFIGEFSEAVIFHFPKQSPDSEDRRSWSRQINTRLRELEREVFLSGRYKAFMLPTGGCPQCEDCVADPADCRHPGAARPTPEGLAIDVFATARSVGYPVAVLTGEDQRMNRYAILLIE